MTEKKYHFSNAFLRLMQSKKTSRAQDSISEILVREAERERGREDICEHFETRDSLTQPFWH